MFTGEWMPYSGHFWQGGEPLIHFLGYFSAYSFTVLFSGIVSVHKEVYSKLQLLLNGLLKHIVQEFLL